jgi:23S rRNA pseudouridine2605 synthase
MKAFIPSKTKDSPPADTFQEATRIYSKLHAIGRLDADTSGLLLLTNDGGLLHHVTNPYALTVSISSDGSSGDDATSFKEQSNKLITKTYEALIMGYHTDESLQSIREGVDIGKKYGGMTKPVHALQILDHPNHKSTVVSLTISEGKNRQVRRMFHSIGSGVMKLQRTKIGEDLTLGGVDEGHWRLLSDEEVERSLNWKPRDIVVEDQTFRTVSTRRRRR